VWLLLLSRVTLRFFFVIGTYAVRHSESPYMIPG